MTVWTTKVQFLCFWTNLNFFYWNWSKNWTWVVRELFQVICNFGYGIPIEFPSQREKKYWNRSINNEIEHLWSREWFGGKYNIGFGIPIKFPSQRNFFLLKSVQKQRSYALILKIPKSSCLKWTYRRPGIDYRVASLFTRYLTAIWIIP